MIDICQNRKHAIRHKTLYSKSNVLSIVLIYLPCPFLTGRTVYGALARVAGLPLS